MAEWKIGYAEGDITPAPGMAHMAGYGFARAANGVLSPLRGQVLALRDGKGVTALLVAVDILGFERTSVDYLRKVMGERHGVKPEAIMLAASHTHWGPATNARIGAAAGAPNPWYVDVLENTLLKLVDEAMGDLAEGEIAFGECAMRVGVNRRRKQKDGSVAMQPNPEGVYDAHTPVVRLRRKKSPKQIVLVSHGCHPTASGKLQKWWPCWPGVMRQTIEAKEKDTRVMFALGCAADAKTTWVNPENGELEWAREPGHARAAGRTAGRAVLKRLGEGEWMEVKPRVSCGLETGELKFGRIVPKAELQEMAMNLKAGYARWWARQMLTFPDTRKTFRYDVQAWRLGNELTLIGLEGEPCAEFGPRLRKLAGTKGAMVVGYVNETSAYIPTAQVCREGGYEGHGAHQAYLLPGPFTPRVEEDVVGMVEKVIRKLKVG